MGKLTRQTVNNYKTQLRKMRAVLPLLAEDHPERPKVIARIEKLTNQLGMEMSDLEIQLARGPGRPRSLPDVDAELKTLEPKEDTVVGETLEHRETRFKQEQERRRQALGSSDAVLNEMLSLGGDSDERPKQDADEAREVKQDR